jgi:trehalose synthase
LERFGIDKSRPILTQISPVRSLQGPGRRLEGVSNREAVCGLSIGVGGRRRRRRSLKARVLAEVRQAAGSDPDVHVLELPAFVRSRSTHCSEASTIVIQKSLREGFGSQCFEALWKKNGGRIGGGWHSAAGDPQTHGLLAHSVEGAAYQIRFAVASGNRLRGWASRAVTCSRELSDHREFEAVSHIVPVVRCSLELSKSIEALASHCPYA